MRLRAVVAYDGTAYQGWQSQSGRAPTVQQTLERALSTALREPVRVAGAGRTDTGVHARGQVIAFDVADGASAPGRVADGAFAGGRVADGAFAGGRVADGAFAAGRVADGAFAPGTEADPRGGAPLDRLLRSVNGILPRDVALLALAVARPDFDPRRDAIRRGYAYRVWNGAVRSPFEVRTSWHVREPLDTDAMADAARLLIGEHDFASFQGADNVPRPSVRRVVASAVERSGDLIVYRVEANAFVRHMVRNVVGELVAIGRGRGYGGGMAALLAARDRSRAAATAPPHGLCLEWVRYPEDA